MSEAIVLKVEGLEFRADNRASEPRVLDVELARRAGMTRPRDVRVVIARAIKDGSFRENEHFTISRFETAKSPEAPRKRGRTADIEYWLTEAGALKLMTRLRTPTADAMVDDMIRVYREALRQLRDVSATLPIPVIGAPGTVEEYLDRLPPNGMVRDNPLWVKEFKRNIRRVADKQHLTWNRAEGWLRKSFGAVSYLRIPSLLVPEVRRILLLAEDGDIRIVIRALPAAKHRAADAQARQQGLFGAN